eukprot:m.40120 g.40120  ORF g.40120 m.40120 type:complete len:87 (+) comp32901_c0_seq3:16-276(+)
MSVLFGLLERSFRLCSTAPVLRITPYTCASSKVVLKEIQDNLTVIPEFISRDEEEGLVSAIEKALGKRRYEHDHWDDVCVIIICSF